MQDLGMILTLSSCTTAHFVIAAVMALYARHRVKYLSIAWVMALFAFSLLGITVYTVNFPPHTAILAPTNLILLMAASFLQSIYPLSIPMPAFLQWGRMWKYASPAIGIILIYILFLLLGMRPVPVHSFNELNNNLQSPDLVFRLLCLGMSLYYIINILRLPRRMSKANVPTYLKIYTTILGINALFYALLTCIPFQPLPSAISLVVFTMLNLYQCLRALESMAIELPKPKQTLIEQTPQEESLTQIEGDFNQANLKRFQRVEHWMQHNAQQWKSNTFGRDLLCRETGINRHLLLQSIRSQGYNNVHEYINSYRIKEVKHMIKTGQSTTLTECLSAGFGTIKTLRTCYEKEEGKSIDEYLTNHLSKTYKE